MEQLIKHTKETWIAEIESFLNQNQFIKESDDFYKFEYSAIMGGQTMIINGHRVDQPGQQVIIKTCIKFEGDGFVSDDDETNKREFTVVGIKTYIGENEQLSYEECLYWDEPDEFKKLVSFVLQRN